MPLVASSLFYPLLILAQGGVPGGGGAGGAGGVGGGGAGGEGLSLRALFAQSFDLFTVLLLAGSLVAVTVIVKCILEIRAGVMLPPASEANIRRLIRAGSLDELRGWTGKDPSFLSAVVHAALSAPPDPASRREAAELAASEECARWFRKIELLSVIGNLGPLLGLAGTVWGMIIAFAALGAAEGQASPAALSSGIAKALFHTLLGLMLAVPALTFFGVYRAVVDRLCNRAMRQSTELVEALPPAAPASSVPPKT